jgi:hypothetical protein
MPFSLPSLPHLLVLTAILLAACHGISPQKPEKQSSLLTNFAEAPAEDSLHLSIETGKEQGQLVAAALLWKNLGDSLLLKINPEFDTAQTVCRALFHFPLDQETEAYVLRTEDFWWVHTGLLIYEKAEDSFVQAFPAAFLIGGDGSQLIQESWLWRGEANGYQEGVLHELSHWLETEGVDSVIDRYEHRIRRLHWDGTNFQDRPSTDSLELVERFPVDW